MKEKRMQVRAALAALLLGGCLLLSGCGEKSYTVIFDLNGGELVSGERVQMVMEGDAAAAPETVNGNRPLSWDRDYSNITADTTVTAQWGPASYTVTFDLSGGELVSGETEQVVEEGTSAEAPQAENGRMELSWDRDFSDVTEDMTVTAQWNKVEMDTADLAEFVQARTVTVNVVTHTDSEVSGSGFFVDGAGTIVTNYHVIDGASQIDVLVSSGGRYDVTEIVDFSALYDLAILKINMEGNEYLELEQQPARAGEKVYAVGSPLGTLTGTFTAGTISSTLRKLGKIECLQMDAAISSGNSGGPLVNGYGDVIGINTFQYLDGENLNLAIKVGMLDQLARDKHWSIQEYREWYATETARSYSPWDEDGNYYYSTVNTYQTVTGVSCLMSVRDDEDAEGYYDCCDYYFYSYDAEHYDQYIDYLKRIGYEYNDTMNRDNGCISYLYYNEKDNIYVLLDVWAEDEIMAIEVAMLY